MICKNELRCLMKDICCHECIHNPNAELEDCFIDRGYIPACKHRYGDCIHDPARLLYKYHNNSWYRERFSLEEIEEEIKNGCYDCDDGECYDDEDK